MEKLKDNWFKIALLILLLVIGYLFALNGRYIKADEDLYFDKWTKTLLWIGRDKIIE